MERQKSTVPEGLIIGRNPVMEALRAGREIDSLLVVRGERSGSIRQLVAICRDKGIVVKEVDAKKLELLCGHANHQGVAAYAAAHTYASVEDLLARAQERREPPFLIVCDEVEDPHNLGAIIRTAEAAGAHGVIIPKRRAASLSFSVAKASAGALEYLPVARVSNLAAVLAELKQAGLWIYGADMTGATYCETNYAGPCALVIGSEGRGLSRLVRERCDFTVSLPMRGKINSLNASVAAGILMYEIARQRAGLPTIQPK